MILGMILVLPLLLAVLSRWLLLRATQSAQTSDDSRDMQACQVTQQKGTRTRYRISWPFGDEKFAEAKRTWRDASEKAVSIRASDAIAFIAIVALAACVAAWFGHRPSDRSLRSLDETMGLTVSLSLHLVGLYIMTAKSDLISQTVGLLVMDHGLYLAIIKIVAVPVPALSFVFGLWCYTVITFVILVYMVPQIRRREGIDLAAIARESNLKG